MLREKSEAAKENLEEMAKKRNENLKKTKKSVQKSTNINANETKTKKISVYNKFSNYDNLYYVYYFYSGLDKAVLLKRNLHYKTKTFY